MNDKQIKSNFSKRLVQLLEKNNMIQQDIVDKFKKKGIVVSRGMVSNWCSGRYLPKFEYAFYLVEILKCSPNDLLKF